MNWKTITYLILISFVCLYVRDKIDLIPVTFHETGHVIIANIFNMNVSKIQYFKDGHAEFYCSDFFYHPTWQRVIVSFSGGLFSAGVFYFVFHYFSSRINVGIKYVNFFDEVFSLTSLVVIIGELINSLFEGINLTWYMSNLSLVSRLKSWPTFFLALVFYFSWVRPKSLRKYDNYDVIE